ncbi:MAG: lysophospholipid acyltransferase family protein, partial [Bacteroidota bacterium]|nr:lysophospholipid acyltransferase family protein [Bacteroidota bacterium]
DVFMEVLKLLTMTGEQKLKRIKYKNPEVLKELFDANKSVICVVGHYGNWEWNGPHILGKVSNYEIYSVVKRLTDKRFEKFLTYIRNKDGGNLIPITQTLRNMIKHRNELTMTIMASDQCPMESEVEYWTKFLNQETPVFLGAEKIAKKLDYCVVFLKIKKVKRGFYEVDVIKITDTPKLTEDLEITEKHVRLLENAIIEQPELWLWSHKRWKYNRKQIKTSITQIYNKNLNS